VEDGRKRCRTNVSLGEEGEGGERSKPGGPDNGIMMVITRGCSNECAGMKDGSEK